MPASLLFYILRADAASDARIQINDSQSTDTVVSEKYGSVTIISLNRPQNKNAITKEMASRLTEAIHLFEDDPSAHIGILHGMGGNFSAGHDLDELREDVQVPSRFLNDDGLVVSASTRDGVYAARPNYESSTRCIARRLLSTGTNATNHQEAIDRRH